MMRTRSVVLLTIGAAAVVVVALALTRLNGFSTRTEPSVVERVLARSARGLAIPRAARAAVNPVPFSAEVWSESRAHFADHCAYCHANDGGGRTEIGQNLYPRTPDMRLPDTQRLTDGELYWIIENGIRLTGMPAWGQGGDNDADTWKLVHFIRRLDTLTPEDLRAMEAMNPASRSHLEEERADEEFLSGKD